MKKMPLKLKPAPGGLQMVVDLVNTASLRQGIDELSDPAALAAWLEGQGLLAPEVVLSAVALERVIDVREGMRALLKAHNDAEVDVELVRRLDRAAEPALLRMRFADDGESSIKPALDGFNGALARLLEIVHTARHDGRWLRMKACLDNTCCKAFYDHSKNRSGKWCSMRRCGSRLHSRKYRRRYKKAHGKWPPGGF